MEEFEKKEEIVVIEETPEGEILAVAEIEIFAKEGKHVPRAHEYRIRIDKKRYETKNPEPTGEQILALAEKKPSEWKLYLHKPGHQPKLVAPDQKVDLRGAGVERFTTMPKDTTEGRGTIGRQFHLPSEDETYLERSGLQWESLIDVNQWLIVHGWQLPPGYNCSSVSIALLIPPSYPDGQIDMVYVSPALARLDGKPIGALASQGIGGETWQRWSRHRTASRPWRPGEDDVASHLSLVDDWFRREFEA